MFYLNYFLICSVYKVNGGYLNIYIVEVLGILFVCFFFVVRFSIFFWGILVGLVVLF